jgi:hypothetical protein
VKAKSTAKRRSRKSAEFPPLQAPPRLLVQAVQTDGHQDLDDGILPRGCGRSRGEIIFGRMDARQGSFVGRQGEGRGSARQMACGGKQ